jgi:L-lactate dehydrogenase complex protein LldG
MSREQMLTDIRRAVGDSSVREIPRAYVRTGHASRDDVLELLVDRLVDYRAQVLQVTADGLADAVDQALNGVDSVVLPPGIDPVVCHASGRQERQVVVDGEPDVLTADQLDRIGAVVTRARVAIALSGTIILDGAADQGRRALSLVPDRHVVVLDVDQVVETVAEGIARIDATAPLTMIAGPSATSDIELIRVEGVHGPRTLIVVLVSPE